MAIRIQHTNDMHGTLTPARFERLRELRQGVDLFFDTGDCIKTGNLGIPLKPEPVWPLLRDLRCTASVLGNRETHVMESAFHAKIAGAEHPVMCGNLHRKDGRFPLPRTLEFDVEGVRVGVLAVMVPMVTERMKTQSLSTYLWDPPIPTAISLAQELRPRVDLLIALTHIGHRQDLELAAKATGIDVILGGHSHSVVQTPVQVGQTYVCQGGSHNRFAGIYEWEGGRLTGHLEPL
jgi:2',3'-cyclic-nucleotide 2'-phosphodiesterase (5'-nucleotidase family)